MNNKISKIILTGVILISFVAVLFFAAKKTISFESSGVIIKKQQQKKLVDTVVAKNDKPIKILFVGDMMGDRYIRQVSEKRGYAFIFQKVDDLLKSSDLVVGNLEGPITDSQSVSVNSQIGERNNYIFTFDPKFGKALADENIKLVNIGNNHISNFADIGIESTRKNLADSNIDFFGDPKNENKRLKIENIQGFKIAFINYNQFVLDAKKKTFVDIANAKKSKPDLLILYTHWGAEFISEPSQKIKDLAHEFVESGVDLIIGSHPHVIQNKEQYKGKTIYYSLGNFIFDQYFDSKTKQGLAVEVEIDSVSKSMQFKEHALKMTNNGQTVLK